MIDFPQMVSIDHPNAGWYFERDFDCIKQYFSKRFHFSVNDNLSLGDIERQNFLDVDVCASGFDKNKKNHKFELAQEIADVDGLDNSEEICDIISISHTFEQLELISDDTLHDSGHACSGIFSKNYIREKVNRKLTKKEHNGKCSEALKNSKKNRINYYSKQTASNLAQDTDL
uniref:non-specific serine/threonine protein kinase n=1 Tax=Henneguya salminicola TaxID=69463 RepID=A0A6G3MJJ6_HENSL